MKNSKSKSQKNKPIKKTKTKTIVFLVISTIFFGYIGFSHEKKEDRLDKTIENLKIKIPDLSFSKRSCFVLNGCSLKNVSFSLNKTFIKADEIILSDKILEIFSNNFVDDKVAGLVLIKNIDLNADKSNKSAPKTKKLSSAIILKLGKFEKSIALIDILFNTGIETKIDSDNTVFKIELFGETDKNVTFKSWDSIPKITESRIIVNKNFKNKDILNLINNKGE